MSFGWMSSFSSSYTRKVMFCDAVKIALSCYIYYYDHDTKTKGDGNQWYAHVTTIVKLYGSLNWHQSLKSPWQQGVLSSRDSVL